MTIFHDAAEAILLDFREVPESSRLELLLEYSNSLPDLPEKYSSHPELLERVEECQSPVFLFVEVSSENRVQVFLTAPQEAPTTRGFAAILYKALNDQTPEIVLDLSDNFVTELGLTNLVSPLRIRGLYGMLARAKRQVSEKLNVD
ncbi:MAG: SufE family protein [Micrococcales bacterium]|nr:SufE family protein [Micrococcales bacterium]NBR61596.1 SufE family protein [Actinomycetota bacterium]NBR54594.1 SufE family protein [Micrococcales bacterium]NBT46731.1 SufE family protein [Actinomycetota bacterium]NBY43826.1 SufE family protein [Micrococcales bacterium]